MEVGYWRGGSANISILNLNNVKIFGDLRNYY